MAVRVPGSRLGHASAPVSPVDPFGDDGSDLSSAKRTTSTLGRADSLPASSKASRNASTVGSRGGLGSREGPRVGSTNAKNPPKAAVAARVIDRAAERAAAAAASTKRRPPTVDANQGLGPDLAKYGVDPEPSSPAPTIKSALAKAPLLHRASWEEKVEAFETLAAVLRAGGPKAHADAAANCAKLADMCVDHAGDAHHRVACAVLEAVVEAVPALGPALEPHLDRLCPVLFPRLVDAKESVRGLASAALAAIGDAHPADALLTALLVSLEQSKAPRAKTGVLEFALYVLSGQGGGTDPHARGRQPASAGSGGLGAWVARVAPLTRDRHAPLRAAAAAGLAAVHTRADQAVLLRYLASIPGADAADVCRAVAPHAPSIEAEYNAYANSMRRSSYTYSDEEEDEEEDEDVSFGEAEELKESAPTPPKPPPAPPPQEEDVTAAALDRSMERLGVPTHANGTSGVDGAAALNTRAAAEEDLDRRAAEASNVTSKAADAMVSKLDGLTLDADVPQKPATPPAATETIVQQQQTATETRAPPPTDAASFALAEALGAVASAGPSARPRALAAVRRALRTGARLGAEHAGQVLAVSLEALAADDAECEVKTHALFTLRDLAQCAPDAFAPHAAIALPRILDALVAGDAGGVGASVGSSEVSLSAGDALEGVVDALPPTAAMRALSPHVGGGGAAPVRCLVGVIGRMEPETLMRCTPDLIPGLVEAFNSPSADVRKAVVDAMVSMYDSLGDWLLPQLSGLSPAQQKLVTIYINRAMEKNGGGGGKVAAKAGAMSVGDASRRPLAPRHQ